MNRPGRRAMRPYSTPRALEEENSADTARINCRLIAKVQVVDSPHEVIPDTDSTRIRLHDQQERSRYNGHFQSTRYHPLPLFNRNGDCPAAKLPPGKGHSA